MTQLFSNIFTISWTKEQYMHPLSIPLTKTGSTSTNGVEKEQIMGDSIGN